MLFMRLAIAHIMHSHTRKRSYVQREHCRQQKTNNNNRINQPNAHELTEREEIKNNTAHFSCKIVQLLRVGVGAQKQQQQQNIR